MTTGSGRNSLDLEKFYVVNITKTKRDRAMAANEKRIGGNRSLRCLSFAVNIGFGLIKD